MNPVAYLPQSKRLLDQVREVLRYKHYSLKTEQAYVNWVGFFVHWHGRDGQIQHPRSMGSAEVTQFLTMLTSERMVSVSTHHQALSALLFLYRQVLLIDLPWLTEVQRPTRPRRIPAVLTRPEVVALLGAMEGEMALLAKPLYGTGMRLMEGLRLRIKDLDLERQVLIVPPDLGRRWAWFGSSSPPNFRLTHAPGSSAGITCTKNGCHDLHRRPEGRRRHHAQPA